MDFFNPNMWAIREGRYEDWHSIYPILVFVLGKLFTFQSCEVFSFSPDAFRICNIDFIYVILFALFLGAVMSALLAFKLIDKKPWKSCKLFLLICLTILLSLPSLFALERGNYIIIAFALLAASELSGRNARGAILLSAAINIKQYLILLWLPALFKRRYDYLLVSFLGVIAINLISIQFIQEENYFLIFRNMLGFAGGVDFNFFEKLWYPTSLSTWQRAVVGSNYFSINFSPTIRLIIIGFVLILRFGTIFWVMLILFRTFRNVNDFSWSQLSAIILVSFMIISDSPGGYSLLLLIPFLMPWFLGVSHLHRTVYIIFLLFTPLDIEFGPTLIYSNISFVSNSHVEYSTALTIMSFVRPFVLIALLIDLNYSAKGLLPKKLDPLNGLIKQ